MPGLLSARELRQKARRLSSRAEELLNAEDTYDDEGRIKGEVRTELDKIHEDQESFLADAQRIERFEDRQEELDSSTGVVAGAPDERAGQGAQGADEREDRGGRESLSAEERKRRIEVAYDGYLRFGLSGIRPEYRALVQSRYETVVQDRGEVHEARAQSTDVDAKGGYLIPEGFWETIVEARKAFGGMRESRATIVQTSEGNDIPIPSSNDTSRKAKIIGEGTTSEKDEMTFGQVMLTSYTYRSDIIPVSLELLQDSRFDLAGFIGRKLAESFGRGTNEHFTIGDNANEPQGVVTGATVGKTAASTTALDDKEITELFHAVDRAYRVNGEWMLSDDALKDVKLLTDGEGRRLWQSGIAVREPNTIEGRPYIVNDDMASPAASTKPIAFGDFALYYIRDVRGLTVLRLDERYAEDLQVAFLAFSRHDGKLVDAGTNPIKVLQMASS